MQHTAIEPATIFAAISFAFALVAVPVAAQLPPSVREVELRVVDPKGSPIQDARVRVCGVLPGSDRYAAVPGQAQQALAPKDFVDGHATLRDLPDGELVVLVESDGHALTVSKSFELPARAPVRLTVRMQVGATLSGAVTTPDGKPVVGAEVHLCHRADDDPNPLARLLGERFVAPATTAVARTGEDGSFHLEHVAPGDYAVRAAHDDWADARREVVVKGKGETALGKLAMVPGGAITGAVQRNGKRLADAVVVLECDPERRSGGAARRTIRIEVRTDANGSFLLPRVPFGTYRLAAHEGGLPLAQALQLRGSERTIVVSAQPDGAAQTELLMLPKD